MVTPRKKASLIVLAASTSAASASLAATAIDAGAAPSCPTGSQTTAQPGVCEIAFTASGSWTVPAGVSSIDVLSVGGGGSGGNGYWSPALGGGGGGGGQVVYDRESVAAADKVTVIIGSGGKEIWNALGGRLEPDTGHATEVRDHWTAPGDAGWHTGASGGGFGEGPNDFLNNQTRVDGSAGGLSGSGKDGGSRVSYMQAASGGGGAGGRGADGVFDLGASTSTSGNGGKGVVPTQGLFAGNTTAYGGGGGGGASSLDVSGNPTGTPGAGGSGGGGNGAAANEGTGVGGSAAPHSGGGGGGGSATSSSPINAQATYGPGGDGADGLVRIRFTLDEATTTSTSTTTTTPGLPATGVDLQGPMAVFLGSVGLGSLALLFRRSRRLS